MGAGPGSLDFALLPRAFSFLQLPSPAMRPTPVRLVTFPPVRSPPASSGLILAISAEITPPLAGMHSFA
jgi:hypothetical protein